MEYISISVMEKEKFIKKKILLIGSTYNSLINFRGYLIEDLLKKDNEVFCSSNDKRKKFLNIKDYKIKHYNNNINRHSMNPISELFSIIKIFFLLKKINPDIIISYTIKPNLYIGILIYMFKLKINFFPIVTGLGYLFNKKNFLGLILIKFIKKLFAFSFSSANHIFFQNTDNKNFFINSNICNSYNCSVIPGSGIDINYYKSKNNNFSSLVFLMSSRLLFEKGVIEYFNAAKIIKKKFKNIKFIFQYTVDENSRDKINLDFLYNININNEIEIIPEVDDIREVFKKCNIFVLPSYHEGLPRTSIEAISFGMPIITTDVPGCRETVKNDINGYIVKVKSTFGLIKGMLKIIKNKNKLNRMSIESRKLAVENFSFEIVNKMIISEIKKNFKF